MQSFQFKDIILQHNMGNCASRSSLSINTEDGHGKILAAPVILSNMPCCQSPAVMDVFNQEHWPYVYNRTTGTQTEFLAKIVEEDWFLKSIAVGVQEEDLAILQNFKKVYGENCLDWITIDVAFIYNRNHEDFIKKVRALFPNAYLIAGNFTSPKTIKWLNNLGVNAGKFGISTSLLCRTGAYTGFSSCASDLLMCAVEAEDLPNDFDLIQDGGITVLDEETGESAYGDIFKALNFGAKWVMTSSLFRWCLEMADDRGNVIQYGNSTEMAKGHAKNVEGTVKMFKTNGISVKTQMNTIRENLQSSMSYAGLDNLKHAYRSCDWRVL